MCCGAIVKLKVGKIVYGCSAEVMAGIAGGGSLPIPCRDIFGRSKRKIEVIGPLLEEEAKIVHLDYWQSMSQTGD